MLQLKRNKSCFYLNPENAFWDEKLKDIIMNITM